MKFVRYCKNMRYVECHMCLDYVLLEDFFVHALLAIVTHNLSEMREDF